MLSSGMKQLAEENGMTVAGGIAYGRIGGFAATLSEDNGWKRISFATTFPDKEQEKSFVEEVNKVNLMKTYGIERLGMGDRLLIAVFRNGTNTMFNVQSFLGWFLPLLQTYGATGGDICCQCGCQLTAGRWVLVEDNAFYMHDACAQKLVRDLEENNQKHKEELDGSYGKGILGALAGATIGAILWGILLMLGYVAALAGLAIGFLADKGYNLLKGKQGKGKLWVLIGAILFGILLGTVGGHVAERMKEWGTGLAESASTTVDMILHDEAKRSIFLGDMAKGIIFAGLGVFGILKKTHKSLKEIKVTILE